MNVNKELIAVHQLTPGVLEDFSTNQYIQKDKTTYVDENANEYVVTHCNCDGEPIMITKTAECEEA